MATLRIVRNREYNNKFRKYKILADGSKIGDISNGETATFELPEGTHTIHATIDWCGSPDIQVHLKNDTVQTLYISGFKYGQLFSYATIIILGIHLLAEMLFHFQYVLYLIFIPFLVLVYYFTIGRKKYLQISDQFNI